MDPQTIRAMARAIVHRGPDDEGYYLEGPLGFGFRRLSIIDLAGGHQPMSDASGSVQVIFNGEIYNFRELRSELSARGHAFRTSSDTEVIVHGYREWGAGVLRKLNGMFGLAIRDTVRKSLLVARDPMGIKQVYYHDDGAVLTFGSEIRAVLQGLPEQPGIDPVALHQFLRFRYTPSPLTILQGIRKLPPGGMLTVENGVCREELWYSYSPEPLPSSTDPRKATDELLEIYRDALRRHLISDVPVGILLSGGLDSNLLLALMNEHGRDWPAYTVGYGSSFGDDELADAAESARLLGGRFIPVHIDRRTFEDSFPAIVDSLEEPIASSSVVPMYFVCQRAREDVKVALVGQGPDELFGGYRRHLGVHYGRHWRRIPAGLRRGISSAVNRLPRNETLKRGVASLGAGNRLDRFHHVFSLAPAGSIDRLFQAGALPEDAGHHNVGYWEELEREMRHCDELGAFQLLELRSSLPDELLMFSDKLSMAHSLEVRVPYLDRMIVEYGQRMPAEWKIRGTSGKWIHREICRRFLPPQILQRRKRGFAVNVVDDWFRSSVAGNLPEMLRDDQSLIYRLLDPAPVRNLLDEHASGRHDNHKLLFSLVMVEQWMRAKGAREAQSPLPEPVPATV